MPVLQASVWECRTDAGYVPYSSVDAAALELAFARRSRAPVRVRGDTYEVRASDRPLKRVKTATVDPAAHWRVSWAPILPQRVRLPK
jgi:hypothetical protein